MIKSKGKILIIAFLVFALLNVSDIFAYPNVIDNADGSKTYEFILIGDKYDDSLNVDENAPYNNYVLNEIPKYGSEIKVLLPSDTEEALAEKKEYNNQLTLLNNKYEELVAYLDVIKGVISDEERNLILSNLPELMNNKIYFDVDYNDVSVSDMKKIYNALTKIYDAVKSTITPLINSEHLGYDNYIYGYNIDFLRSNIKSLKNALSRKEIFKIDKTKLLNTKHNDMIDMNYYYDRDNGEKIRGQYKITNVSKLIDDTYYNVEISSISYGGLDIEEISKMLKKGDTIKIIYSDDEDILRLTSEEYSCYSEEVNYAFDKIDYIDKDGNSKYIADALIDLDVNTTRYIIKVYKNAIYEEGKEYFINYYVGNNKIEDKFYDNIECTNNTFKDIYKNDIVINEFDFDEKGYVKSLFYIRSQYS